MATFHRNLTDEKWRALSRVTQILNITSELNRAGTWCPDRGDYTRSSIERALELIDLSINDRAGWHGTRLHELLRFREVVAGLYAGEACEKSDFPVLIQTLLHMDPEAAALRIV
jgi:hypothetical protein